MRVGDFGLEVVPVSGGVRETDAGHVLARAGQVYRLRLRNFGPLRCVVNVEIDGRPVTGGGLVLNPFGRTDLERPVEGDDGRFTVVAEGDESVFGPDGGRDNPSLGLIEARFRRELPGHRDHRDWPIPEYRYRKQDETIVMPKVIRPSPPRVSALRMTDEPPFQRNPPHSTFTGDVRETIERAAGTGLTGRSQQQFDPITVGALEDEATVLTLRLVIGSIAAIAGEGPDLTPVRAVPERPAARP